MTPSSPAPGALAVPPDAGRATAREAALAAALRIAREWAGERAQAMVLSGSHAAGHGVWCTLDGRELTLSDLDVYVAMPDETACREARARARAGHSGLAARLLDAGVAAPLEVGFLTRTGFAHMPARPGVLELARRGRVVFGDRDVLAAVPRWTAHDVPREETLLLLENRGFELLLAWEGLTSARPLARYQACHGLRKASADLATVLALAEGELPADTASRIAWASRHAMARLGSLPLEQQAAPGAFEALWSAALAWSHGGAEPPAPATLAAEWHAAVRAWCAVWWALHGEGPREPWARALRVAARAPMRRRARQALLAASRGGATAPLGSRLRAALAGTPQHRVNGSAAVLLLAAAMSPPPPARPGLPVGALRALRALDVTPAGGWPEAMRDVTRAWDLWILDGQRTTEDV
ncbi:MAG TPA: hypothetical protein VMH61_04945 [Candidatus Acidoferrales bacterium]|nr:hypothetical protein [Candidatus Acidoferrales bacterium]